MLTALNKTIHTDYFNATLSAFANNWCALCTTASEVSLMSGNDHVGLLSIRRSSPTASMARCPPMAAMAAIGCASQGNLSCPRFVQIVAQQDTLPCQECFEPPNFIPILCRLLSFIQWVEAEHPEVALTSDGCFNPYVVSAEPPLSMLAAPQPIGGCVPRQILEKSSFALPAGFLSWLYIFGIGPLCRRPRSPTVTARPRLAPFMS